MSANRNAFEMTLAIVGVVAWLVVLTEFGGWFLDHQPLIPMWPWCVIAAIVGYEIAHHFFPSRFPRSGGEN